ncbi:MAG: hypothetical protein ABH824_03755 [Nanoarchaeota archaeon]
MASKEEYKDLKNYLRRDLNEDLLRVGLIIDKTQLKSLKEDLDNIKIFLEKIYGKLKNFADAFSKEIKSRKIESSYVKKLNIYVLELAKSIYDFRKSLNLSLWPQNEKEFKIVKKNLTNSYNQIEELFEQKELDKDLKMIEKNLFTAEEIIISNLRHLFKELLSYLGDSFEELKKRPLMAVIQLYIKSLDKLKESGVKEDIKQKIEGEIDGWNEIILKVHLLKGSEFAGFVNDLEVLWNDDEEIFEVIEAQIKAA